MTEVRKCRVPQCPNHLTAANYSGVCRIHNHAAGYCRCRACTGEARAEPYVKEMQKRPPRELKGPTKPKRPPTVPSHDAPIAELCAPLSASVQPSRPSWGQTLGSKETDYAKTAQAQQTAWDLKSRKGVKKKFA